MYLNYNGGITTITVLYIIDCPEGENVELKIDEYIRYHAFEGCTNLKSVTIGDSVITISDHAFEGCTNLQSVTIGDSVTSIGYGAFFGCNNLKSVTFEGNKVKTIDNDAFNECNSLTSITIPDSVETIGEAAFYGCYSLPSINIPDSVTTIGDYVFYSCRSLTSVIIPDKVTSIGNYAFTGCSSLKSINIPDSVTSIGREAFNSCHKDLAFVYYGKCGDGVDWELNTKSGELNISGTGQMSDDPSFSNRKGSIKSVVIGSGVTSIGKYAFSNCENLESVTIGNSVQSIGVSAFSNCNKLNSVTFNGNSVESIGQSAFQSCTSLTSINIPDSVTSIEEHTFWSCTKLESVTIGNSVETISYEAFNGCTSLKSVIIGEKVTTILNDAFKGCTSLTSITIPNDNAIVWKNVFANFDNIEVVVYYGKCGDGVDWELNTKSGELNISGTGQMSNDPKCVVIGSGVTSIGKNAFIDCTSLTSITIPDTVETIDSRAFYRCTLLTLITIPNYVKIIGNEAFDSCTSFTSITIPDSVISIGGNAFYNCNKLDSITIGNYVKTIGDYAFAFCTLLTSITIPDSVTSIGYRAFSNCKNLESVTIGNSVKTIGDWAFMECTELVSVNYLGESEPTHGTDVFIGTKVTEIIVTPNYRNDKFLGIPVKISGDSTKYWIVDKSKAQEITGESYSENVLLKVTKENIVAVDVKAGYYVNYKGNQLGDALIYCSADSIDNCEIVEAIPGYYAVGAATGSAESYIVCDNKNCIENEFENYNFCQNDFELPTCTNEAIDPNNTCVENAADGEICETCREYVDYKYKSEYQFFNARYKRVLRQKSIVSAYRCTVDTTNGRLSDCNIYVNKLPMITTVPTGALCVEGAAEQTFFINSVDGVIYQSMPDGCTLFTTTDLIPTGETKYFYFDKEFRLIDTVDQVTEIYAYYQCDNLEGTITCTEEVGKPKGVIVRTPNSIEMCTDKGKSIPLVNTSTNPVSYFSLEVNNEKDFAGISSTGPFTLKTTGKSIIKIDSSTMDNLPTCYESPSGRKRAIDPSDVCKTGEGGAKEVNYCIGNTDNKIYKSNSSSADNKCNPVTSTTTTEILFFDWNYETVDSVDTSKPIKLTYKCTFTGDGTSKTVDQCTLIQGHVITDSDVVVTCSGLKNDECSVKQKSSLPGCGEGSVKSGGNSICFGTKEINIPSISNAPVKYIAFASNNFNPNYGVEKGTQHLLELAFVESGTSYVTVTNTYSLGNGFGKLYFVNEANPKVEDGNEPIIGFNLLDNVATYSSVTLTVTEENPEAYYLDGSDSKNIIICTYGGSCISTPITNNLSGNSKAYYINAGVPGDVIKCDTTSCTAKGNDYTSEKSGNTYYFVDTSDSTKKSVIKCVAAASGGCTTIKNVSKGIFMSSEGKNVKCGDTCEATTVTAGAAPEAKITMDTTKNKFKFNNVEVDALTEGYLILSAAGANSIYSERETAVIKLMSTAVMKVTVAAGYYTVFGANDLSKALIECNSDASKCKVVDAASGYYKFPGERKVIKCDKTSKCTELDYALKYSCGTSLPKCTGTTPSTTCLTGANIGTHCISCDKIYANKKAIGGRKRETADDCGELLLSTSDTPQYFAFDANGSILSNARTLDNAHTVVSTYYCEASSGTTISKCYLVSNELPEGGAVGSSACVSGVAEGQVSENGGALFIATNGGTNCAALTGTANSYHYFDHEYKEIDDLNSAKFIYYCTTATDGALSGCKPVQMGDIGDIINVDQSTPKICISTEFDDVIGFDTTVDTYMKIKEVFPDAPGDIKITQNSITKLNDAESTAKLPVCKEANLDKSNVCEKTGNGEVNNCAKSAGNHEIYKTTKTGGNECSKITGPSGENDIFKYFLQGDGDTVTEVTTFNSETKVSYVYKCNIGEETVASSGIGTVISYSQNPVKGCSSNLSHSICCSGLKGEDCIVETLVSGCSTTTEEGKMGKTSDETIAYYTTKYNRFHNRYGIIFLSLKKNSVSLAPDSDIEVGYYVNPNANKLKNALIYCKTANTLDECQIMDGIDGAYFTTVTGSPYDIIKCDKNNGCKYHKLDQVTCG
ncbi:hypothetical protein PIROE2DRAFT_3271, partial [Piromyces sp. E2]